MKITPYILICWSSLWKPKICRMSHFNVRHVSFFWRRAFSELTSTIRQVIFSMTWSDFVEHKFHRNIFHLSFVPSFFPFDFLSLHLRYISVILESIVGQDYFEWNLFLEENSKGIFFSFSVNRKSTKVQNNILMSLFPITSLLWKRDWLNMFERRCHQIRPLLTVCSSIFHHFVIGLPPIFFWLSCTIFPSLT